MRVSKEKAAENRDRIIDVAARLFRERGFEGIGVADLMREAGLTHGGFYGHFASKEELMALAAARATEQNRAFWQAGSPPDKSGPALARQLGRYLSPAHRDAPGAGCPVAALGMDAARQSGAVREEMGRSVSSMIAALEALLPAEAGTARHEQAIATCATMVGALVMARATTGTPLSDEILAAVSRHLGAAGTQQA